MSKLLVSTGALGHGGAERVLSVLSTPLADNFDEVIYLLWVGGAVFYSIDPRVRIVDLSAISGEKKRLKEIPYFRRFVLQENPDIILSFMAPFNMLTLASTFHLHYAVLVAERNDPNRIPKQKFLALVRNILYRRATAILTQTITEKEYFRGQLATKTRVIYNPIKMESSFVGQSMTQMKTNTIVTAGRLVSVKRHKMLIDAFAIFLLHHPDYKLEIYGVGPERENLLSQIKDLRLENSVFLQGGVSDLWPRMLSAKMFVLPSDYEGMSNSLIEAMCLGLPCISTKVSGAIDLIRDGENGLLIDVGDETALLDAMLYLADNPDYATRLGTKATEVYEMLRVDEISKQWVNTIKECCSDF